MLREGLGALQMAGEQFSGGWCLTRYAPQQSATRGPGRGRVARIFFSCTTMLVTEGTSFYNPFKTA